MSKKFISILCAGAMSFSVMSAVASAAPAMTDSSFWSWHNLYVLGQLGWGKTQLDSLNSYDELGPALENHTSDTGAAGRIALGYSLLPRYLDIQLGYTQYRGGYQEYTSVSGVDTVALDQKTRMYTVDLDLEGKLPINQFYLLGKVGEAYVHFNQRGTSDSEVALLPFVFSDSSSFSETTNAFRPLVGAGVGFNASEHVFIEANYQYLFGTGNTVTSKNPIPNTQFASLGLGYRF